MQAAQLSSQAGSEQKLEVFVNLARRLQSLVHREISILDELENEIEDPDLLKGLFHVDHLATRIRRHAENLAVLGGAVSRRQWSNPVSMTEVLRSAIAEVEQYSRVKLVPPIDGELRGHAVADVIHLLAELVENATVFSAPHTQVLLRANLVTSGLAVEVEDRGLGMPVGEQSKMNALLADPDQVNVASLLADGRIGLFVVSQLARRHGIHVRLQTNIYGGVQAVLVVPQGLLGTAPGTPGAPSAVPQPRDTANGGGAPGATGGPPGAQGARPSGGTGVLEGGRGLATGPVVGTGSRAAAGGSPAGRGPAQQQGPAMAGAGGRRRHEQPAGAPAPLPVRGAQETRPNPAEALPGIRPEDRSAVAEHAGSVPVPRVGAVRGTMGKPQLPRRRAQEHIVPQLRGGPAPRQDNESPAGHDPGLMAAFQRGIGLAEAQQHLEATQAEPTAAEPVGGTHGASLHDGFTATGFTDLAAGDGSGDRSTNRPTNTSHATHMDATHMDATHMEAAHVDAAHREAGHLTPDHTAPGHTAPDHTVPDQSARNRMTPDSMAPDTVTPDPRALDPLASGHMALGHMTTDHMALDRMTSDQMTTGHPATDHLAPTPTHLSRTHRDPADTRSASRPQSYSQALRPVHTSEFTARPDGSAPAG